jgi:hypothetical protein
MIADLIVGLVGSVIEKVWPDPAQKAAAALAIAELQQKGELAELDAQLRLALAQVQVNDSEAKSGDPFASRWRPFIGWVCGFAFAWNFIGLSVARFVMQATGHPFEFAPADMGEMMPVLLGMLGLGGMRTFEKVAGAAKKA